MEESGYAGFIMPIEVYFKNKVGSLSGGQGRAVHKRGSRAGDTWVTDAVSPGGRAVRVGVLRGRRVHLSGRWGPGGRARRLAGGSASGGHLSGSHGHVPWSGRA